MASKLKTLSLMQLSEKFNLHSDKTRGQKVGSAAKIFASMGISYGLFTLVFYFLFRIIAFKATTNLFIFLLALMQLISIIGCVTQLTQSLYISKDNALLLTYPVKHSDVFISKILVAYIVELRKSLILTLPLFMSYMTMVRGTVSASYIIFGLLFSVILPLFPVVIGALISIPVVFISKWVKQYDVLKIILTVILFGGLLTLVMLIIKALPDEIRLLALSDSLTKALDSILTKVNKFALYNVFAGKAMLAKTFGKGILNFLLLIASLVAASAVSILAAWPLFFKLASSSNEFSIKKEHKSNNQGSKNIFLTFLRKEFLLSSRNVSDFASDYSFLIAMPIVLIIISSLYVRVKRNELGIAMTYGFIGLMSLLMLSASNTASASAISSEGNEFVLLKTAPGKTKNIIWAKVLVNFALSFIVTTVTFVILTFTLKNYVNLSLLWFIYLFVILIDVGLILWSIQLDILHPKLREFANSKNKGDIKNTSTSIVLGLVVAIIASAFLIAVFAVVKEVTFKHCLIIIIPAVLFIAARFFFLVRYTDAYFDDIQF